MHVQEKRGVLNAVVRVPVLIEDEEVARVLDLYGARPGDHILVRPEEDPPVTVLRYFDRNMLPTVLELLSSLPARYSSGDRELTLDAVRGSMEAEWYGERRLRVVR